MLKSSHPVPRIFISHSHNDNAFCLELVNSLRQKLGDDTAVWYDSAGGLHGGDAWWDKIKDEIKARPVFIIVLSPDSLASPWVQDEIRIAWQQKNSPIGKRIIPILYKHCEVPDDLSTLQIISFLPPKTYEAAFNELLKALRLPEDVSKIEDPKANLVRQMLPIIQAAFSARDWLDVIYEVNRLIKLAPGAVSSTIYYLQAQAFLEVGNIQGAIFTLNSALALESNNEQRLKLLRELSTNLASQGRWNEVLHHASEALQLVPGAPNFVTLQKQAHIQLMALKISEIYDKLSIRISTMKSYWKLSRQNSLNFVRHSIKSKWFKPIVSIVLIIAMAISFIAAYPVFFPKPPSKVIEIATDLPISGDDTHDGKPVEDGAHLAVDLANAYHIIPGYTLQFVPKDDVGPERVHDPGTGARNINNLISDALVAGIIGPFNSSVAQEEMPIANQAPIALISPSNTNPCLTKNTPDVGCIAKNNLLPHVRPTGKVTYFRIASPDSQQGTVSADYLFKIRHYKTVYVIDDDTDIYSHGLALAFMKEWEKLGGNLFGQRSEPSSTTEDMYRQVLTPIGALHPDVIYFAGDTPSGTLARQAMEMVSGLENTPYAGGDGIVNDGFATTISPTGGSVYGTVPIRDAKTVASGQDFIAHYEATYNERTSYSASGYDCANILIQAIKTAIDTGVKTPADSTDSTQAKVFRQAIIDAIQHISYNGVTGRQSFDRNGDTTNKVISIYKLNDMSGRWDYLDQQKVK